MIKELIEELEALTDKGEKQELSKDELNHFENLSSIITTYELLTVPIGEKEEEYSKLIMDLFLCYIYSNSSVKENLEQVRKQCIQKQV